MCCKTKKVWIESCGIVLEEGKRRRLTAIRVMTSGRLVAGVALVHHEKHLDQVKMWFHVGDDMRDGGITPSNEHTLWIENRIDGKTCLGVRCGVRFCLQLVIGLNVSIYIEIVVKHGKGYKIQTHMFWG
eukprot:gene6490-4674_t